MVTTPLGKACEAIVVIPVRNEENWIIRCLSAFNEQEGISPDQFELIVLLNNCTDASEIRAQIFKETHPSIQIHLVRRQLMPHESNIGTVRRLLMDEACARFSNAEKPSGAILTTDGDTVVDTRWIAQNLIQLRQGVDAVGGRISLDVEEMRCLSPHVRQRYFWDLAYGLLRSRLESQLDPLSWDPWPRHHQNFCGSLCVTAAMYSQVGGVPHVQNLEDVALCESILQIGGRIRHSPLVQVRTSARLSGRVGIGLSSHLRSFESRVLPMVESVELVAERFRNAQRERHKSDSSNQRHHVYKAIDKTSTESHQVPIDVAIAEIRKLTY